MSYTRPTLAEFIAIYPVFAAVTQPQYDLWVADAETVTLPLEDCLGGRMLTATMLATADLLVKSGLGTGAESEAFAQGTTGFKSIRSGSITLERADTAKEGGAYSETSYGRQLWPMLKACLGGPRVTGTGSLPCIGVRPWGC